jgi:hypothetical protein
VRRGTWSSVLRRAACHRHINATLRQTAAAAFRRLPVHLIMGSHVSSPLAPNLTLIQKTSGELSTGRGSPDVSSLLQTTFSNLHAWPSSSPYDCAAHPRERARPSGTPASSMATNSAGRGHSPSTLITTSVQSSSYSRRASRASAVPMARRARQASCPTFHMGSPTTSLSTTRP